MHDLVLLLGDVAHEGITSALVTSGRVYRQKLLRSKPDNWRRIESLFQEHRITAVLAKISPTDCTYLAAAKYGRLARRLFSLIERTPHAVFLYEGLLSGNVSEDSAAGEETDDWPFYRPPQATIDAAVGILYRAGIEPVPYETNAELTTSALQLLADTEKGLLLRVYIPHGRMWAEESRRLLHLFRDYLTRVAGRSVRLEETTTEHGSIYEFHGDREGVEGSGLASSFEDFSKLLDLSCIDREAAEKILADQGLEHRAVVSILTRYAKEARRLQVDIRQEREQKLLSVRHRMESELTDALPTTTDLSAFGRLVDSLVPSPLGLAASLSPQFAVQLLQGSRGSTASLTVNIHPQHIEQVHGIVAEEVQGDIRLTREDQNLIKLFKERPPEVQNELQTDLQVLKDNSAPKDRRVAAKQKLKAFLYSVASRLGEAGTGVLQKYLERLLLDGGS